MSYPEPPGISSPGGSTHYLATHASTGGEFGLYRADLGPRAAGAEPHFHKAMSESWRVAEVAQRGGEELKRFRVRHDSYFVEDTEDTEDFKSGAQ